MQAVTRVYLMLLRWVVILTLAAMLLLVFANVVLRYTMNTGLFLAEGLSGLFYVWMTMCGALLVLYDRGHIGVDMLVQKLSPALAKLAFFTTNCVMLFVTWMFLQGSWQQMMINLYTISPATRLPVGLMYGAGVFFAVMSGLFLIGQIVLLLRGKLAEDELLLSSGEDQAEAERLMREEGKSA